MDFRDFLDPHRPYKDEVDTLRALFSDAAPDQTIRQFTPVLRDLFRMFTARYPDRAFSTRVDLVREYLDHLNRLHVMQPTQAQLNKAPKLDRWCAVFYGDAPLLLGRVTGHPVLREGARARTSPLFQIAPDRSWARTRSRVYELRDHFPGTLHERKSDRVIPADVRLIRFK